MNDPEKTAELATRPWRKSAPDRLIGRGHPAGDFLEAYDWLVEERSPGRLTVLAHVPARVRNPRGQLFGGFAPTYVDLISIFTVHGARAPHEPWTWLATTNMKIDYLAPVLGPQFRLQTSLLHRRKRAHLVETRFFDLAGELLLIALTNMLAIQPTSTLGDG